MKRARVRDHTASILVAGLSSAFGVLLLEVTAAIGTMVATDGLGDSGTVVMILSIVSFVFLSIAVYVSAVVTSNTFATIIAGRTRTIALMRLIGSSAGAERRAVTGEGLVVGVLGALMGATVGIVVSWVALSIMARSGFVPDLSYEYIQPVLLFPVVIVILTTWMSSWVGSRKVLEVTPLQAVGASQEPGYEQTSQRRARTVGAITLFAAGLALLILGVVVGLVSVFGVLIGVVGGMLSFSGLIMGAHIVMPPSLGSVGRLMGHGAEATLASANALRYPERSTRMTIGLVIGVTLITMFAVAMETYRNMIHRAMETDPLLYEEVDQVLNITVGVFSVLIGFSAIIAAVGMVNNLSLSVLQRQRELGLLRALGFSGAQVRRVIVLESAQYSIAAVGVGLMLGVFYGWAGAQSLLGSIKGSPGIVAPSVPWQLLVFLVVAATLLTVIASVAPAKRATRISPIAALSID